MTIDDSGAFLHLLTALAHAALAGHLSVAARRAGVLDASAWRLIAAMVATAAWAGAVAVERAWDLPLFAGVAWLLDLLRYALLLHFLLRLVQPAAGMHRAGVAWAWSGYALVGANLLVGLAAPHAAAGVLDFERTSLASMLALGIFGLVTLEQLFRNQREETRWNAKPVCLGLACVFGFDLYLHSEALMFGRLDEVAMDIRGAIHSLSVPLLFIASRRHQRWIGKLQVSRTAAFYSAALLLAGGYLLFMAAIGYYVRFFGGSWGRALQLALVFGALVVLAGLALSASWRARLRVFLGKNFFSYRYDYREEWLRFTAKLSANGSPQEVGVMVVRALADLIECPAGSLWTRSLDDGHYMQSAQWNVRRLADREPADSEFCRFMHTKDWIVDLAEYRSSPRRYEQLALPMWLVGDPQAWVVVPLMVAEEMIGFVILNQPRTTIELNWEVRDLLKIASRQAASYLARMHATEALLEARKFDAFNRMSAFVVHDLKNIITQLSLMMKNAQRLRDNPEFQQDMLLTVESSLEKMRQMMLQLREGQKPVGVTSGVDLVKLLQDQVASARLRGRSVELEVVDRVSTRGHEERVARVLGHVVQNALDATPAEGRVWITLRQSAGRAMVQVGDTGAGMTPEFIQTQLFKPFSTTKQSGMGIGSYESFHYIKELGGQIDVDSVLGQGTVMTILLPFFDTRKQSDLQMTGEP
jgi:putative PEP-CTERM system histidine kinase